MLTTHHAAFVAELEELLEKYSLERPNGYYDCSVAFREADESSCIELTTDYHDKSFYTYKNGS